MRLYFSRKFCLFQAIFSTFSPSAFLRCSAKLSLLRSFSLGGWFRGGAPWFPLCRTKSPLLRAFRVSYFRNYLRGFLMFACASSERDFLRRCSLSRGNTSPFRQLLLSASRKCKTLSPSAFLRCSAKLSLLRSFSLGGCFRGGAPCFLPLHNEKPASAGFSCSISRNYLRGFLMLACAAAWMSEAASAYFIPRNYLRGFLMLACAAAWMSEAASAHFIPRNYLRGFLIFACAAASLAIGTRKGEQET